MLSFPQRGDECGDAETQSFHLGCTVRTRKIAGAPGPSGELAHSEALRSTFTTMSGETFSATIDGMETL
jgi:hypothetical protein